MQDGQLAGWGFHAGEPAVQERVSRGGRDGRVACPARHRMAVRRRLRFESRLVYDRFDAVVLLSVPREVMLQRIATRSTNPFGKDAHERQRILADLEAGEPLLRATSTVEIVTTIPVTKVVDALESIARRADGGVRRSFHTP